MVLGRPVKTQLSPDTEMPVSYQDAAVPLCPKMELGKTLPPAQGEHLFDGIIKLVVQISFFLKNDPHVHLVLLCSSLDNGNYQMEERIKMEKTTKKFSLYWSQTNWDHQTISCDKPRSHAIKRSYLKIQSTVLSKQSQELNKYLDLPASVENLYEMSPVNWTVLKKHLG